MRALLVSMLLAATVVTGVAQARWAHPDCTCRAPQGVFHVGEETCIRGVIATCEMTQNVTSWNMSGGAPCQVSQRDENASHAG